MDKEKLIACVFSRRSLWDHRSNVYHNRDVSKRLWSEVAEELDSTSEICKSKWRGLRDTFRRELHRHDKYGTEKRHSVWQYFDDMMFIRDQIIPRTNADGPVAAADQVGIDSDDDLMDNQSLLNQSPIESSTIENGQNTPSDYKFVIPQVRPDTSTTLNPQRRQDLHLKKRLALEQKKVTQYRKKFKQRNSPCEKKLTEDADYHFLLSLLPYLRNVAPERKLTVRTKLQQLFCDEEAFASNAFLFEDETPQETFVYEPSPPEPSCSSTMSPQHQGTRTESLSPPPSEMFSAIKHTDENKDSLHFYISSINPK